MEILFVSGQILCAMALAYGAWLAIAYSPWNAGKPQRSDAEVALAMDPQEQAAWRNYLACDV